MLGAIVVILVSTSEVGVAEGGNNGNFRELSSQPLEEEREIEREKITSGVPDQVREDISTRVVDPSSLKRG